MFLQHTTDYSMLVFKVQSTKSTTAAVLYLTESGIVMGIVLNRSFLKGTEPFLFP